MWKEGIIWSLQNDLDGGVIMKSNEFRINNGIVRIYGSPKKSKLEEATIIFIKKAKRRRKHGNVNTTGVINKK